MPDCGLICRTCFFITFYLERPYKNNLESFVFSGIQDTILFALRIPILLTFFLADYFLLLSYSSLIFLKLILLPFYQMCCSKRFNYEEIIFEVGNLHPMLSVYRCYFSFFRIQKLEILLSKQVLPLGVLLLKHFQ